MVTFSLLYLVILSIKYVKPRQDIVVQWINSPLGMSASHTRVSVEVPAAQLWIQFHTNAIAKESDAELSI